MHVSIIRTSLCTCKSFYILAMILSENSDNSSDRSDNEGSGNPAMADAMRKVLHMGKNIGKATVVLAKAKLLTDAPKEKHAKPKDPGFEVAAGPHPTSSGVAELKEEVLDDIKPDSKSLVKLKKLRKVEWSRKGRLKPTPLDREKERPLMKIATRGVVQLFNAVHEQQKFITQKVGEVRTEAQKEKALKLINKRTFLDVLKGQEATRKQASPEPEVKTEDEDDKPNWSVLREDFIMDAKLKDWNEDAMEESPSIKRPKKSNIK